MKIGGLILASALLVAGLSGCNKQADAAPLPRNGLGTQSHVPAMPSDGWTAHIVQTADGGFLMGNPNAAVKVVEYGSRTCPHCARFSKEGEPLLKSKYVATGKVSYEYRDFPIHAPDLAAILLGQCNGPGPFFPILEQMMADQDRVLGLWGALPASLSTQLAGKTPTQQSAIWADQLGYIKFVAQRGVPGAKARACLADTKAVDLIGKHITDGVRKYGVNQTPFFIINGVPASGVNDWTALDSALATKVS